MPESCVQRWVLFISCHCIRKIHYQAVCPLIKLPTEEGRAGKGFSKLFLPVFKWIYIKLWKRSMIFLSLILKPLYESKRKRNVIMWFPFSIKLFLLLFVIPISSLKCDHPLEKKYWILYQDDYRKEHWSENQRTCCFRTIWGLNTEFFFRSQGVLKTVVFTAALTAYLPLNLETPAECIIIEYVKNETFRFLFRKLLRLVMSILLQKALETRSTTSDSCMEKAEKMAMRREGGIRLPPSGSLGTTPGRL